MNLKAQALLKAFDRLPAGAVIVEVGCVRFDHEIPSDGFSTIYLGQRAKERGWNVTSIDISPEAVDIACRLISGLPVTMMRGDGATLIAEMDWIDGLFLDGSADPADTVNQYLASDKPTIVVVDDAQAIERNELGKATNVIEHLMADGYDIEIVDTEPGYRMLIAS